ncbi:transcobalamin-1-like [Lates calcarifer]|uniref:Transcobalamin-1-like n=1 Tax=Lates calcarifer TaxID=8187 RepID=A0AAJ8B1U1_LATCA|nr:transcobalamin-1-like [Lates calcarifer]XP_050923340.1 transcobalamin-1-like [Lates calcarifer]XP_050923677.1 transcobalamin-1-like [Lates calcarifer]
MMMMPALSSAALLLLLLLPGTLTESHPPVSISVVVESPNTKPVTYTTHVVFRGILLGALKRLMNSNANFKFTYTEDPNYGPYLESVNGVAGSAEDHTYWELLVETPDDKTIRPDVGIGCYIPSANDKIILRFSKYNNQCTT